jgi:hypothetical protein
VRPFLEPVTEVDRPTADAGTVRYIRSFLLMRVMVGVIGIGLPFALVLIDGLWFDGSRFPRTSLSAYYYSGVRELFVGALCATGVFLVAYKVADVNLDNTLSVLAGIAVLGVALFPTDRPNDRVALTPLQEELGETFVAVVHYASAVVFIVALGVISYFFGKREGARPPVAGARSPGFWRAFHWACAGVIGAALLWILVTEVFGTGPAESLLIGEAVSVWAFGVSWLWKGLEVDMLRGR